VGERIFFEAEELEGWLRELAASQPAAPRRGWRARVAGRLEPRS